MKALKQAYEFPGKPLELHALDFCQNYPRQSEVEGFAELGRAERRAAYDAALQTKLAATGDAQKRAKLTADNRKVSPFIHLTRQERSRLLEDGLDLVGSHDGLRLFAEATDKRHLFKVAGHKSAVRAAFTQLVSRFDAFLDYINRTAPSPQKGLIVMDREPTYETYLHEMFRDFRENGHPFGQVRHVIEAPFFTDSALASGIQLADLCAYATRRYIERADKEVSFEKNNYLRIHHRFDRAGHKLHGIRHFCARATCRCLICSERGNAAEGLASDDTQ